MCACVGTIFNQDTVCPIHVHVHACKRIHICTTCTYIIYPLNTCIYMYVFTCCLLWYLYRWKSNFKLKVKMNSIGFSLEIYRPQQYTQYYTVLCDRLTSVVPVWPVQCHWHSRTLRPHSSWHDVILQTSWRRYLSPVCLTWLLQLRVGGRWYEEMTERRIISKHYILLRNTTKLLRVFINISWQPAMNNFTRTSVLIFNYLHLAVTPSLLPITCIRRTFPRGERTYRKPTCTCTCTFSDVLYTCVCTCNVLGSYMSLLPL